MKKGKVFHANNAGSGAHIGSSGFNSSI